MRIALRTAALGYLGVLVLVPLAMILFRTFEDGFVAFFESVTTPAAISAISLSLLIVAIVVPLNVVFGLVTALALARGNFRGKGLLQAVVDLPFAVSPVIVGVGVEPELRENPARRRLDGLGADVQEAGDRLVRPPFGHRREDFALALRE